ncbi:hypothetical protein YASMINEVIRUS_15 [Yasminevirus sp. GU-2018]|uniref:Uncharacterized protein n=1 Tax=Yasminevirus sp. GU-2018 TaxID=2420051 RepID=A0A5K0U8B3_9VIRU|nr:hypothetical protein YASMINEVIRUS_15 [Yasminevirus sp. GU-2018]
MSYKALKGSVPVMDDHSSGKTDSEIRGTAKPQIKTDLSVDAGSSPTSTMGVISTKIAPVDVATTEKSISLTVKPTSTTIGSDSSASSSDQEIGKKTSSLSQISKPTKSLSSKGPDVGPDIDFGTGAKLSSDHSLKNRLDGSADPVRDAAGIARSSPLPVGGIPTRSQPPEQTRNVLPGQQIKSLSYANNRAQFTQKKNGVTHTLTLRRRPLVRTPTVQPRIKPTNVVVPHGLDSVLDIEDRTTDLC